MECGDSSPPCQVKFISPYFGNQIERNFTLIYSGPMNWPVQGGDESPHCSMSEALSATTSLLATDFT